MEYAVKRLDWLVDTSRNLCEPLLNLAYSVSYEHTERLLPLSDQGFIMLPKHQHAFDVVLEAIALHDTVGRNGNYLMKSSLPKILEYYGTISITRAKDLMQGASRAEKLAALETAKGQRAYVEDAVCSLLLQDEIVVVHPEGTRMYHQPSKINVPNVSRLLRLQQRIGRQVPFVPLDIYYEDLHRPRSRIVVKVGTPIRVNDDELEKLLNHIVNEIELINR